MSTKGDGAASAAKAKKWKRGELVLVEHGSSVRGQVAVVIEASAGMVVIRKYLPDRGELASRSEVPTWKVKGKPAKSDERATGARELLRDLGERAYTEGT